MLGVLNHKVLRDRIGWPLVSLIADEQWLQSIGLVCLTRGLAHRTRHCWSRRSCSCRGCGSRFAVASAWRRGTTPDLMKADVSKTVAAWMTTVWSLPIATVPK
jgi:hypothetical protein